MSGLLEKPAAWLRRPRGHAADDLDVGAGDNWFTRYSKSIIFLIIVLAIAGAYLAFTIPVSVFPTTNFPRVIVGVDNGVMPIDQMMVTVTRHLPSRRWPSSHCPACAHGTRGAAWTAPGRWAGRLGS